MRLRVHVHVSGTFIYLFRKAMKVSTVNCVLIEIHTAKTAQKVKAAITLINVEYTSPTGTHII